MRKIDAIFLHCTDTPDGRPVTVAEINAWHKARGWNGIGYHWVIHQDGRREMGRPESIVGAHVEGHNANSIGVCWVGRSIPAAAQRIEIIRTLAELLTKYGLDTKSLHGHGEYNKGKTCPNLDMNEIRAQVGTKISSKP